VLLLAVSLTGCKSGDRGPAVEAGTDLAALCAPTPPTGPSLTFTGAAGCTGVIENHPVEGCYHVPCPPASSYATRPPSSGDHDGNWPDFHTYPQPVPWANLVHALEHGAIVIVYNCPGGCPDEVAQAQAFIDALPVDSLCTGADPRRVILAPDPTLDVRWAATAWTWTLRAGCFLTDAFAAFARDHYGQGREPLCTELGLPLCP
jgi:hypothetical protein